MVNFPPVYSWKSFTSFNILIDNFAVASSHKSANIGTVSEWPTAQSTLGICGLTIRHAFLITIVSLYLPVLVLEDLRFTVFLSFSSVVLLSCVKTHIDFYSPPFSLPLS
jgi:hypothetical protein